MGYDAIAYAVVGVLIKADKITSSKKVKTYNHDYPSTLNFCPITGKELWKKETLFIDGTKLYKGKFVDFPVNTSSSEDSISEPETDCYVGKVKEFGYFFTQSEIEETKNNLKKALSAYNLWDEDKFGVYPVLYESF